MSDTIEIPVIEIVLSASDEGFSIALKAEGRVTDRSPLYRERHVAMMLAQRMGHRARDAMFEEYLGHKKRR